MHSDPQEAKVRQRTVPRLFAMALTVIALLVSGLVTSAPAQAAGPRPVVFVHGYLSDGSVWGTAKSVFRSAGYTDSQLFSFSYNYNGDNRRNAASLASFVASVKSRTGARQVDIVNHSMGGLVTMYYEHELGGTASTARVASLAGANHGTTWAAGCIAFTSCQQMYPGSSFIATVTRGDETPGPTSWATWYSPCDGIIIPYTSTPLSGARNTYVSCVTHLGFLTDTSVLRQVASYLRA